MTAQYLRELAQPVIDKREAEKKALATSKAQLEGEEVAWENLLSKIKQCALEGKLHEEFKVEDFKFKIKETEHPDITEARNKLLGNMIAKNLQLMGCSFSFGLQKKDGLYFNVSWENNIK